MDIVRRCYSPERELSAQMSKHMSPAMAHVSPDVSHMSPKGRGGTDGQAVPPWTGCRRNSEEASCLPTCSARRPVGLVQGGVGVRQEVGPSLPGSSFLSSPLSFKWLPTPWHNQIGNLLSQCSTPPGLPPALLPRGAKVTL